MSADEDLEDRLRVLGQRLREEVTVDLSASRFVRAARRRSLARSVTTWTLVIIVTMGSAVGLLSLAHVFRSNLAPALSNKPPSLVVPSVSHVETDGPEGTIAGLAVDDSFRSIAYVVNGRDGTVEQRRDLGSAAALALSPNAARYAVTRGRSEGRGVLELTSVDGQARVLIDQGAPQFVAWSPDGRRIAFTTGSGVVLIVNAQGGPAVQLSHPPVGCTDLALAWSFDGSTIAVDRDCSGTPMTGLYLLDARTGSARLLAHISGNPVQGITWSEEDKAVVFGSGSIAQPGLYRVSVADGSISRLTKGRDASPFWTHGGLILFVRDGAIWRYDVASGEAAVLASVPGLSVRSVSWSPVGWH